MNVASTQAASDSRTEMPGASSWIWAALACAVCGIGISSQSLWIDEALTAAKASQVDFHGWWQAMLADKASDLQMPLYMIYVWGFAKVFGVSEWALRAANVPWFVAGVVALVRVLGGLRRMAVVMAALMSAFVWYYLDEARPYAMQIGASLMVVAALYRLGANTVKAPFWMGTFLFGIVVLSGSSLLGMIWAGAGCLGLMVVCPVKRLVEMAKECRHVLTVTVMVLISISTYYIWTLKVGARASDLGRTNFRNIAFIGYELLGFGGLGPGRLEIRNGSATVFMPYLAPLALYGTMVCYLAVVGWLNICRSLRRKVWLAIFVTALPIVVILGAGVFMHFRVLGRHFAPLSAITIMIVGMGIEGCWSRKQWAGKAVVAAFFGLSLIGCVSLRMAERHRKDDYRGAAEIAKNSLKQDKVVWWNASREGAVYYGVPLAEGGMVNGSAILLMNPPPDKLAAMSVPDVVVSSKPDVYDGGGVITNFIGREHYFKMAVLPAFTVWEGPVAR